MQFRDLGLSAPILKALEEQGYRKPSPIQEQAIPPALAGRDVLGCAQTGTGKTCAFATPILQRLKPVSAPKRPVRALVLTPTRELAIQIGESFSAYGKHLKLRHTVIFGGVGQNPQVEALQKGVDILVATPGRLMDLHDQGFISLDKLEIFVLDEADRMLDMGFIHDVRKILKWLPQKKQTLFFSATMPPEIADLVSSLLKDPARVAVDPISSPVEVIRQSVYLVDKGNKTNLLAHLMGQKRVKNALVFTRTKHGANKVARDLGRAGISAAAIHGNKSQTARQQALADFKAGRVRCLVATDIAARGLDIEELSHVFNYNLPEVPETYVHRIGRTGRAGRGGEAISFCDFGEQPLLKDIEKLLGKKVPLVEDHPYPMQNFEAPKRDKNGKIINEEDAEARQAARTRGVCQEPRRQREGTEAVPRTKKAAEQAVRAAEEAPQEKPKKKRHKKKGEPTPERTVTLRSAAPPEEEEPLHFLPPSPAKRGLRAGVLMDTGDAMPNTEFHRPNPLDSDVIMDATARLLAPRRSLLSTILPDKPRQKQSEPQKKKKDEKPQKAKASQPDQPSKKAQKPAKSKQSKKAAPAPQKAKKAATPQRRDRSPEPRKTKDSTEQASLMKPYYLDIGR